MKAREVQRELAIFRILAVCFFAFCFLLGKWMNTAVVFAAPRPASLEIPIVAEVEGEKVPAETFRFIIEKVSSSSVLPVPDTIEGIFSAQNKKRILTFPAMQFHEESFAGNEKYVYTIRQIAGTNPYMEYDSRVYTVKIRVGLQTQDSMGHSYPPYLAAAIVVTENDNPDPAKQDVKQGEILFHNKYTKPPEPTTETPPNPTRPPDPTKPPNPNRPPDPKVPETPPVPSTPETPPAPSTPPGEDPKIYEHKDKGDVLADVPKIMTKFFTVTRKVVTGDESGMFFFGTSFSLSVFGLFLYYFNREQKREKRNKHEWD